MDHFLCCTSVRGLAEFYDKVTFDRNLKHAQKLIMPKIEEQTISNPKVGVYFPWKVGGQCARSRMNGEKIGGE